MASKIVLKKSSVAGKVPTTSDLEYGELAINYADKKLYFKTATNEIDYLSRNDNLLSTVFDRQQYTVTTPGTNTFSVAYEPGFIDVYVNGVKLNPSEYTATNGSSVTITGLIVDDEVQLIGVREAFEPTTFDEAYNRQTYTATSGQTTFAIDYNVVGAKSYVQVYVNGVLIDASEYTATSGTNVVLTTPCVAGDIVELIGFSNVNFVDLLKFTLKTSNHTLTPKQAIIADTSGGSFTVTLPATPALGDQVFIAERGGWATNPLTVARNGSTIEGNASNITLDYNNALVQFLYDGTTWQVFGDSAGLLRLSGGTMTGNITLNNGTANGVAYLNSSKVLTTGSALTFDGTNFATTGSVTSAGASNSGNLNFTGTGNRLTGDFSNATTANRVIFQTSTTNGQTRVALLPNGTATDTAIDLYNSSSDTVNVGRFSMRMGVADAALLSTRDGTGTYLPMTFYTGGSERVRIDTSGNVGINTSTAGSKLTVLGTGSFYSSTNANTGSGYLFSLTGASSKSSSSDNTNFALFSNDALASNPLVLAMSVVGNATVANGYAYLQASEYGTGNWRSLSLNPAGGNVGIGTSSPQALLDVKNGTTYSSSGTWLARVQQNTNIAGNNGLSVMNAWAADTSKIFECAMGWNGTTAGYYPVFTVDGLGQVIISPQRTEAVRIESTGNFVFKKSITETVFTLTGTALNPANGTIQTITLASNTTLTDSLASGQSIILGIDDGSAYTVTWPTITWTTTPAQAPTLATTGFTWVVLWKVGSTLYGKY